MAKSKQEKENKWQVDHFQPKDWWRGIQLSQADHKEQLSQTILSLFPRSYISLLKSSKFCLMNSIFYSSHQ